ncbi:Hypothetical protein R9X50_00758300 [Acrodontium crateriforme]|uniref:Acyl-CoA dehydrogenase n=1 Tax=Acrodontium crateriforme TaxID=150365 RepID=A0AAQ3MBE9_9PEZI|nr:Hypothetical protein R9X50_00758300 [Acrodontium crateriforme]
MSPASPKASSASTGFFQPKPKVRNQFDEDVTYRRTIAFYLSEQTRNQISPDLSRWGAHVLSPQVLTWLSNAESHPPSLQLRDSFGSPASASKQLITSEGWRNLQDLGLKEGIVAIGYEKQHGHQTRLVQFLKMFLWCGSSSTVTCPSAMQDGAARLIYLMLEKRDGKLGPAERKALESAYARLTSRTPGHAWTSGQWMTERTGGSDVRGTETRARKLSEVEIADAGEWISTDGIPLGDWSVDGFKWFSSATDADMAVFLAKTGDSDNLSLFFAPTRRLQQNKETDSNHINDATQYEFNGIYPQRLKNKLGTKALPTAELELKGMRAHLLGTEGQGTKEISPVLNITRVYNAVSSVGALGRSLAISRAFARVRKAAGGRLLMDIPAHVRGMANVHVQYRGDMALTFFVVYLLGISESEAPIAQQDLHLLSSKEQAVHLLRLLTPVTKAMTALTAISGIRFCMESLGGVGYLENEDIELNLAKIFRDTNVLAIWEGTTDVLAGDTVRVLTGSRGTDVLNAFGTWVHGLVASKPVQTLGLGLSSLTAEMQQIRHMMQRNKGPAILYNGRELLERISWITSAALLVADAARDNNAVAVEVARRWIARKDQSIDDAMEKEPWESRAKLDRKIVFESDDTAPGAKL